MDNLMLEIMSYLEENQVCNFAKPIHKYLAKIHLKRLFLRTFVSINVEKEIGAVKIVLFQVGLIDILHVFNDCRLCQDIFVHEDASNCLSIT